MNVSILFLKKHFLGFIILTILSCFIFFGCQKNIKSSDTLIREITINVDGKIFVGEINFYNNSIFINLPYGTFERIVVSEIILASKAATSNLVEGSNVNIGDNKIIITAENGSQANYILTITSNSAAKAKVIARDAAIDSAAIGQITDAGVSPITAYGHLYSDSLNNDALNLSGDNNLINKTVFTNPISIYGIFTSNLDNLIDNTTYYVKAYVTNAAGTSYSKSINVIKTISGNRSMSGGNIIMSGDNIVMSGDNIAMSGVATMLWNEVTGGANWSIRRGFSIFSLNNHLWILGGYRVTSERYNDVWRSESGVSWTSEMTTGIWSKRREMGYILHNNKMWIVGGYTTSHRDEVYSSNNGIEWDRLTNSFNLDPKGSYDGYRGKRGMAVVSFSGALWVLGGENRDNSGTYLDSAVFKSITGDNWELLTSGANWHPRYLHRALVYDDKIWIMGGNDGSSLLNDVWSSSDGINWEQHTPVGSSWGERDNFGAIVFDNKIWVIGGDSGGTRHNDVWSSSDGINWALETQNASWSARAEFGVVVHNNKIWIMGGNNGSSNFNDVWYYEEE